MLESLQHGKTIMALRTSPRLKPTRPTTTTLWSDPAQAKRPRLHLGIHQEFTVGTTPHTDQLSIRQVGYRYACNDAGHLYNSMPATTIPQELAR